LEASGEGVFMNENGDVMGRHKLDVRQDSNMACHFHPLVLADPRRPWTFEMEADCHESSQKLPFWEFISSCLADKEELKMNPS